MTAADSLALYRQMLLIRRSEEHLVKSHQRGLIHGACHTYVGEEAIAVGRLRAPATPTTSSSAPIAAMATPWPRGCRRGS